MKQHDDIAGVVAPPPLMFAAPLVAGLLLSRRWPARVLPARLARGIGLAVAASSFLIGFPAFRAMRRAGTDVRPQWPTTALVTSGAFRYSRNPIYLSLSVLYAGLALAANSLWSLLFLPVVVAAIDRGVVAREEQYLERKFGDTYRSYRATVRRWL